MKRGRSSSSSCSTCGQRYLGSRAGGGGKVQSPAIGLPAVGALPRAARQQQPPFLLARPSLLPFSFKPTLSFLHVLPTLNVPTAPALGLQRRR